jgi:hypothetical protein
MKIRPNLPARLSAETASALIVTLIICCLAGIVLGSALSLSSNRHAASMRATAWNSAIPVLESGIEEALTHLQKDSNSFSANNWTAQTVSGTTVYWKKRILTDGSYYFVTNANLASATPVIYAAGYVPVPLQTQHYISRKVQVTLTNPPSVYSRAIASNGQVTLSGGAVVDGYSSNLGAYNTTSNRTANGGIATNSKLAKGINVGTAIIYGTAVTGPGGTVSVAGGAVGDVAWDATHTGIEPGFTNNNMNVAFPSNSPPTGTILPLPPAVSVGGSNIVYLTGGTTVYQTSSFTSSDKTKPMLVTGKSTLWITGDLTVSGSGYIYIAPGASLTIYVGGKATVSGGGVVNGTQLPANFSYFGLSSNTQLTYSGSAAFVGTINAPQADCTISGSAGAYGAAIVNSYTSSGGSGFHYDSALNSGAGYIVTSWTEL